MVVPFSTVGSDANRRPPSLTRLAHVPGQTPKVVATWASRRAEEPSSESEIASSVDDFGDRFPARRRGRIDHPVRRGRARDVRGAAVIVVEILGTRVIGPLFGVSLFVSAALLAVTLGSLAIGYYGGGVLVDRSPKAGLHGAVVTISGCLLGLVPALSHGFLGRAKAWPAMGASGERHVSFRSVPEHPRDGRPDRGEGWGTCEHY